jgi:uncharacterized membrane protein YiaA
MEETIQRNIVFDFEIIALLVLVVGVGAYALGRKLFKRELNQSGPFEAIDLLLMFIPAFLFLLMPSYLFHLLSEIFFQLLVVLTFFVLVCF